MKEGCRLVLWGFEFGGKEREKGKKYLDDDKFAVSSGIQETGDIHMLHILQIHGIKQSPI